MKLTRIALMVLFQMKTSDGLVNPIKVISNIKNVLEPQIFEGIQLPRKMRTRKLIGNLFQIQKRTNIDVLLSILKNDQSKDFSEFLVDTQKPLDKFGPRDKGWREIYASIINDVIKVQSNDADPMMGYLYFGNQDFKKILTLFCQTNPFFVTALTASDDDQYLELLAYDETGKKDYKYTNVVSQLNHKKHRINVRFNKDMTINEISNWENGTKVIVPEEKWDYYAGGILYNLIYYSSLVHATIHVLHYLMCAGIREVTKHDSSLKAWAKPYDANIAIKYLEVAAVLFPSNILESEPRLISSPGYYFDGNPDVMQYAREYLCLWGSFKTESDFTKKFLFGDLYKTSSNAENLIEKAGLLTEFKKSLSFVQPFAAEMRGAMAASTPKALEKAENNLKKFMTNCGEGVSSIDTMSSWISLMSSTGLMHGGTLSYTRLVALPEVLQWRGPDDKLWSELDSKLMATGLNTMQGMTVERHTFTSEMNYGTKWNTKPIAAPVMKVLEKYNNKATKIKTDYTNAVQQRPDFREFGWIMTDPCLDGFDGKQFTITTYI